MAEENKTITDLQNDYKELKKKAFIVGFTGATGKVLVKELIETNIFEKVLLLGRRKVDFPDEEKYKILDQRVVNFDNLEENQAEFSGCDVGFCCLGTTKGKSGKDGFYKVDHDYIMSAAKVSKAAGCQHFHVVSSQGAAANSFLYYTKVKGEVEEELKTTGFDRLSIYRPAFLWGDRDETRMGETILKFCLRPVKWLSPTAATTPLDILAKAMLNDTVRPSEAKWKLIDNSAIFKLAEGKPMDDKSKE